MPLKIAATVASFLAVLGIGYGCARFYDVSFDLSSGLGLGMLIVAVVIAGSVYQEWGKTVVKTGRRRRS